MLSQLHSTYDSLFRGHLGDEEEFELCQDQLQYPCSLEVASTFLSSAKLDHLGQLHPLVSPRNRTYAREDRNQRGPPYLQLLVSVDLRPSHASPWIACLLLHQR